MKFAAKFATPTIEGMEACHADHLYNIEKSNFSARGCTTYIHTYTVVHF